MKLSHYLGGTLIASMGLIIFLLYYYKDQFKELNLHIASFYAKEICTCLYVLEQDETYCRNYSRQLVDLDELLIDQDQRIVRATLFSVEARAVFRDPRLGCILNQQEPWSKQ